MQQLKLGTHRLSTAEAGLVRALVLLLCNDSANGLNWIFVNEAPFDALLVGIELDNTPPGSVAIPTLYLVDTGAAAQGVNVLTRPLRSDLLRDWLANTQRELSTTPRASGGLTEKPKEVFFPVTVNAQFKLRKWPPQEALRGDPARMRMATLLGKRALTLGELTSLSRQPEHTCEAFLQLMRQLQLLDKLVSPPSVVSLDSAPVNKGTGNGGKRTSHNTRDTRWGLVRSIRMRLGLN